MTAATNHQARDGVSGIATTLAITSGKGGVGKTSLATNLGIALSQRGHRVCLLDADMGLANVNILLGLRPELTLEDVITRGLSLDAIRLEGPAGLHIIPSASEFKRLHLDRADTARIADGLAELERRYDYLVVDTPAGISPTTLDFVRACDHVVLTVTQEPTSLTDAFSLVKAINRPAYTGSLNVVANMLPSPARGQALFQRFNAAAERYLDQSLTLLGALAMDAAVTRAVLAQSPFVVNEPGSGAAAGIHELARTLEHGMPAGTGTGRFGRFWQRPGAVPRTPSTAASGTHAHAGTDETPPAGETPGAETAPADDEGEPASKAPPAPDPTADEKPRDGDSPAPKHERPPADGEASRLEALTREITDALANAPESEARRLFGAAETAFTRRFRRRNSDIKALLYEALLRESIPPDQQRDLLQTLFAAYRRSAGEQGDRELGLPELAELSREDLLDALQPLSLRLTVDAPLARRLLDSLARAGVGGPEWRREDSESLLATLAAAHAERFGESLPRRNSGDNGDA